MSRIGDVAAWPATAPNANALPYELRLRGWRLWLNAAGYGLAALACFAGAVVFWLASLSGDRVGMWLCVGLAALGAVLAAPVYFSFKPILTLYPDRIEKTGLFGTQTLYRSMIEGAQAADEGGKFLLLKSASPAAKSMRLSTGWLSDPTFATWLGGMRDLSAEAFQASEAEILADSRLGSSEAERARRLLSARRLVQIATYLSFAVYLWVFVYPAPYRWAIGAAACMPLFAGALVWTSRGLIVWGGQKTSARPSVMGVVWGSTAALALRAFLDIHILDWLTLVEVAAVIGICFAWPLTPHQEGAGRTLITVLAIALLPAAYVYGAAAQLNRMLDPSPAAVFQLVVRDHHVSSGRSTTYDITVDAWGDQPAGTLSIPGDLYREAPVGSTVCVYRHTGWLKLRWFYVDHCEGWTPPAKRAGPASAAHHS